MSPAGDPYRAAALAYFAYGLVYLVGGLYLVSQGVGVRGGESGMLKWGLLGLVPLTVIPALLWHRWSWLGGWISRRTFAWLVAILLAARSAKVGQIAVQGGGSVPAPWGGNIGFQAGAIVFLLVTLVALAFVVRAARTRDDGLKR